MHEFMFIISFVNELTGDQREAQEGFIGVYSTGCGRYVSVCVCVCVCLCVSVRV